MTDPSASVEVTQVRTVTDDDTAAALGSGDLPVLATPRLLAWAEAATCAVLAERLDDQETSVGVQVAVDHSAPSPVGAAVHLTARLVEAQGRRCSFQVLARDASGQQLGEATVTRAVVDRHRFLARLGG